MSKRKAERADRFLRAYRTPSGRWSGIVLEDGVEITRIDGCECLDGVVDGIRDIWPDIELEPSEAAKVFWARFAGVPNTDP